MTTTNNFTNTAIKNEMEAVRLITRSQDRQQKECADKMIDLVLKRSIYSDDGVDIHTAVAVYQKLVISQKEINNQDITLIEKGISMLASNKLLRSNFLKFERAIKLPIGTSKSNDKDGSDCGGMLRFDRTRKVLPTRDLLGIKFNCQGKLIDMVVNCPLWIRPNGMNPMLVLESPTGYINLATGDEYSGEEPKANKVWKRYVFMKSTPSEIRLDSYLAINTIMKGDNGEYFIDDNRTDSILDELTYGAVKVFSKKGQMKLKKFAKAFARLAQWSPYSREFGSLNSFWEIDSFDLAKESNGKVCAANDGISYVYVDFIIESVYKITGVRLSRNDLLGKAIQCRPGLSKAMAIIVDERFMKAVCARHDDIKYILGAGAEFPEYLVDKNCNKADVAETVKNITFDVLAGMVKLSKPNFNMQLITKIANSDNFEVIMERAYEDAFNKRFSYLNPEKLVANADIKAVRTGTDSSALMAFAPELTSHVDSIRRNAVEVDMKAFLKDLKKMKLPMRNSEWRRFVGDVGSLFGIRLLKEGEVFVPGMKVYTQTEVIRFPSVCAFEHYSAKTVGYKDLKATAREEMMAGHISLDEFIVINEFLKRMDKNLMLCPIDQAFRDLTGGSDTDSDMGVVIHDKDMVSAIRENEMLAIDSDKPIKDINMGELNSSTCKHGFLNAVKVIKVGVACNHITALYELKGLEKGIQISIIMKALDIKFIGKSAYTRKYNRNMTVRLNTTEESMGVLDVIDMWKIVDLTNDSYRAALIEDAIVVAKTINDRVIDAPKTGDAVEDGMIPWRKHVKSDVFAILTLGTENTENGVKYSFAYEDPDKVKAEHCGRLSKARRIIADRMIADINGIMNETVKLSQKEISLIQPCTGNTLSKITKSFEFLKEMYKDESGMKRTDTNGTDNDFLVRQKVSWYGNHIKAITNMGMMVSKKYNLRPDQIGKIAMYVSALTKSGVGEVISNNFMTVCFPAAVMQMAAKYYNANTELRQEIYAVNNEKLVDGEIIEMKNGTGRRPGSDKPVCICGVRLNGDFAIAQEEYPGIGFFVTSSIEEEYKLPEVNGRILLRMHRNELKDRETVLAAKSKIDKAVYGVIYCKLIDKKHSDEEKKANNYVDAIYLFDSSDKLIGKVKISIDGYDLMEALHEKKFTVVDSKYGVVRSNADKDIYAMSVLGDLTQVADSTSEVSDAEEDEEVEIND